MTTITDEPFRADVDEVLARYGLDDPGHAVLASDLSDAFDEAIRDAAAEVERLRSEYDSEVSEFNAGFDAYKAGLPLESEPETEHDLWRAGYAFSAFDDLRAEVERLRAQLSACEIILADAETERDMWNYYRVSRLRAALAAVPAAPQPQADDRLMAVAERAVNLLISDIHETLMGMVSGWRDTAHDHYCQTYNKGMGEGLEDCAKQLEAYLNGMYQRDRAAVARRAVDAGGGG